jgi:predicted Zn-ribbon and HTH transcriptional regulator
LGFFWRKKQEHFAQIALVERERCDECGGRYEVVSEVPLRDNRTGEEILMLEARCGSCGYEKTYTLRSEGE